MLNLKKALTKLMQAPIVVEQGTSGVWTYRKWSDGTAECWGRIAGTANVSRTWGTLYICDAITITFPSGLYISAPVANILAYAGTSVFVVGGSSVTTTGTTVQLTRTSNASASYVLGVHVIGKWK